MRISTGIHNIRLRCGKRARMLPAFFMAALMLLLCSCGGEAVIGGVNSAEDLDGRIVGILKHSGSDGFLKNAGIEANVISYETVSELKAAVESGTVDCAVVDEAESGDMTGRLSKLKKLEEPFVEAEFRIAISPDNKGLCSKINSAIESLTAEGTISALEKSYKSGDAEISAEDGEPFEKTVVAAVVPDLYPFAYKDEAGEITGIEPDILTAICKKLNIGLSIVETDEENIMYLAESGKVSMAVVRDVFEGEVIFTDPYITVKQYIIVRKG